MSTAHRYENGVVCGITEVTERNFSSNAIGTTPFQKLMALLVEVMFLCNIYKSKRLNVSAKGWQCKK